MNKKVKKNILQFLIFNILFFNTQASVIADSIYQNTRYEIFNGKNIQVSNILEEDKVDVLVDGKTLVNLVAKPGNTIYKDISATNQIPTFLSEFKNKFNIKPNTEYTYFLEIKVTEASENFITFPSLDYVTSENVHIYHSMILNPLYGNGQKFFKSTFTTGDDVSHFYNYYVVATSSDGNMAKGTQEVVNMILLEGNHMDKNLDYFEGIKSVGENSDINDYSIKLKVSNKNLFDINKWINVQYGNGSVLNGIDYENKIITVDGVRDDTYTWTGATGGGNLPVHEKPFLIKVEPNTMYTLSFVKNGNYTGSNYIQQYDESYKGLNVTPVGNSIADINCSKSFITNSKTRYIGIRFGVRGIGNSITYSKVQLELGDSKTEYNSYDYIEKIVELKKPLRGLSENIKDRIIKKNGQWVVERNCGEIIYDGSSDEIWYSSSLNNDSNSNMLFLTPKTDLKLENTSNDNKTVMSDILGTLTPSQTNTTVQNMEGISGNVKYNELRINISKSKLNQANLNGLRQWLQDNPIKVVYQLETPYYEYLKISTDLNMYKESSHFSNDSIVPGNMEITIDRVANRAQETINIAKTKPTTENIAIARMWTNLMRESLLKDEFHEEVNNILEIEDLEIEKKKASANLDLYIKTKNTLSLSLDTNSITFDNYSGVEDMELLSAVNLTVNSSLPYSLNAYMEEGFYNSDKTSSLEVNSLNIRENTETVYKQFTNIKEKVVLKDNCDEGNEKYHTIDFKLNGNNAHKTDVYKTVIKFEIEQK